MNRIFLAPFAAMVLAGCGAPAVIPGSLDDTASVQAQSATRIVGTVAKSTLAGQTVLTMSLEAKRPLLKNTAQDYTFYTFMDKETRRWRGSGSGSRLFLGKDGGIYISSGPTNTELWYRVGTYQSNGLVVGLPLSYTLDGEHAFDVSNAAIHLRIYHAYQSRTSSELEWSRKVPRLFEVN